MRACDDVNLSILRALPFRSSATQEAAREQLKEKDCGDGLLTAINAGSQVEQRKVSIQRESVYLMRQIAGQVWFASTIVRDLHKYLRGAQIAEPGKVSNRDAPYRDVLYTYINNTSEIKTRLRQYSVVANTNYNSEMLLFCRLNLLNESFKAEVDQQGKGVAHALTGRTTYQLATKWISNRYENPFPNINPFTIGRSLNPDDDIIDNSIECFSTAPQSCIDYVKQNGEKKKWMDKELSWAYASCQESQCATSLRKLEKQETQCHPSDPAKKLEVEKQCRMSAETRLLANSRKLYNGKLEEIRETVAGAVALEKALCDVNISNAGKLGRFNDSASSDKVFKRVAELIQRAPEPMSNKYIPTIPNCLKIELNIVIKK